MGAWENATRVAPEVLQEPSFLIVQLVIIGWRGTRARRPGGGRDARTRGIGFAPRRAIAGTAIAEDAMSAGRAEDRRCGRRLCPEGMPTGADSVVEKADSVVFGRRERFAVGRQDRLAVLPEREAREAADGVEGEGAGATDRRRWRAERWTGLRLRVEGRREAPQRRRRLGIERAERADCDWAVFGPTFAPDEPALDFATLLAGDGACDREQRVRLVLADGVGLPDQVTVMHGDDNVRVDPRPSGAPPADDVARDGLTHSAIRVMRLAAGAYGLLLLRRARRDGAPDVEDGIHDAVVARPAVPLADDGVELLGL